MWANKDSIVNNILIEVNCNITEHLFFFFCCCNLIKRRQKYILRLTSKRRNNNHRFRNEKLYLQTGKLTFAQFNTGQKLWQDSACSNVTLGFSI